jgi:Cu(I)/Ag(I) efflux system protein CusF
MNRIAFKHTALAVLARLSFGAFAASHLTDAEVRKVDTDAGKLTLKHGQIKDLDMPAMTMVFQVKDKTVLDSCSRATR